MSRTVLIDCPRCHGVGELYANPDYPNPQTEVYGECPRCHGDGALEVRRDNHDDEETTR